MEKNIYFRWPTEWFHKSDMMEYNEDVDNSIHFIFYAFDKTMFYILQKKMVNFSQETIQNAWNIHLLRSFVKNEELWIRVICI